MKKLFIFICLLLITNTVKSQIWFKPLQTDIGIQLSKNIYISNSQIIYGTLVILVNDYYIENTVNGLDIETNFIMDTDIGSIILTYTDITQISNLNLTTYKLNITLGYIDGKLLL